MFLRKFSVLAFSALSLLLSSVQTPKTLQPADVVPVIPRHPACWWDEHEPEVLGFTPANSYTNGSTVLTQEHFDISILPRVHVFPRPAVSVDLASAYLAQTAPANPKLAGSQVASPNIAGFDIAWLAEGVLTAAVAVIRALKRKTGAAWATLALSLLLMSGMLVVDVQLEQWSFLNLAYGFITCSIAWAARVKRRLLFSIKLSILIVILIRTYLATFDNAGLDRVKIYLAVASTTVRFIRSKTRQLAISVLVFGGMLVFDAFHLGELGILVKVLRAGAVVLLGLPWMKIRPQVYLALKTAAPHVAPVIMSTFDSCLVDVLHGLAFHNALWPTIERSLPSRLRDVVAPSPAPWTRRKRPRPKKRIRLRNKVRLASIPIRPPLSWIDWCWGMCEAFLNVLSTVSALLLDIRFFDMGFALILNGTAVDFLLSAGLVLRLVFPPSIPRVRRTKERYRRGKNKTQHVRKP